MRGGIAAALSGGESRCWPHCEGNCALSQQSVKQNKLSAAQIEAYLAAQPEVLEIQKKIVMRQISGEAAADIAAVVQKHGFRDAAEYSEVLDNLIRRPKR